MPRADDRTVFDPGPLERQAYVWASAGNGIDLTIVAYEQDGVLCHYYGLTLAFLCSHFPSFQCRLLSGDQDLGVV